MDRDFLIDLFADFGPVTIRRMFSGFGISADGTTFALALRAGLYFRADEATKPLYEAEGSHPFQYQTRARTVTVNSYWQLPARLFDDSEELSVWARAAWAAAQRAALKKLFSDPRFNVMDGLDTYVDDYTKAEPVTEELLARLEHARQTLLVPKQEEEKKPETEPAKKDDVDKRQDA